MADITWGFNDNQLASWEQARGLAKDLNDFRNVTGLYLGGGVAPETSNEATSGIYVPTWLGGPGGFPVPSDLKTKYWLHFRFNNGRCGINVGLILDKITRYGGNKIYVYYSLTGDLTL